MSTHNVVFVSYKKIKLLPAREFPLDKDGISQFRDNYRSKIDGDLSRSKPYKSISKGTPFAGVEWYLPCFLIKQKQFLII